MNRATLLLELKKIARQLQGSENIFGYKSTVANQLYLLYCFSGNIYFTDKISKGVKFFWYSLVSCEMLISYSIGLTYLRHIFSTGTNDTMLMINVASAFGGIQSIVFGLPVIFHFYGDRIEAMIDHVDTILASQPSLKCDLRQNKIIAHAKEKFLLFMGLFVMFCLVYLSVCYFEVLLFFDEDKIKNYLYYAFPPPLIREYASLQVYFTFNGVLSLTFAVCVLELWSGLAVLLYWNIVCCDQLTSICDDLGVEMQELAEYQENEVVWNTIFEYNLIRCVKRFQNVTPLINYLRGFTEVIASFLTMTGFGFGVACLHVCVLSDFPLVLKVKYLMGYLGTGVMIFLFYWIGQNLNNSVTKLSFAIFSTPWYKSAKVRKNVYVLLCQTQSMKDFVIIKVYGMLLNNFSKYLNGVFSLTNLLRKLYSA